MDNQQNQGGNNKNATCGCNCMACKNCGTNGGGWGRGGCGNGWSSMHRFSLLRIILALIIVGFIFWAGMKFGEFKAVYTQYMGWGMGGMRGGYMMPGGMGVNVMYGRGTGAVSPAVPVNPTTK